MEKCQYREVPDSENVVKLHNNKEWKPFLRQLLVCSGVWTSVFLFGLSVGAPTVFIPQIRKEANNTSIITNEMASWLTSLYSFSGFPFVLILSIVTRFLGRKIPFAIAILDTFVAFTILYCSSNVTHIVISEIMQGLFSAGQIVVSIIIITEYTSPKYRGIFLTLKSATFYWGIWASNAIGSFLHWKNIPLFAMACALYTLITILFWPESPIWLASRGKFRECAASHRWLKGCDEEAEKELEALIHSQKEYIANCKKINLYAKDRVTDFFRTIKSDEFYKPTMLSFLTSSLSVSSGKLIFTVYAIDIVKEITNSESTAYITMLILDGITVLSMYGGSVLAKFLKRRPLLLVSSTIAAILLFILSSYLYLIHLNVIKENKYVFITLLVAFSIAVSCGPLIMSNSIYGELIPIRSRNLSVCLIALMGKLVTAVSLKTAPFIFNAFGLHGAFLWFGITMGILIIILYKYLPETKDKTLQEIADVIKGNKLNNSKVSTVLIR